MSFHVGQRMVCVDDASCPICGERCELRRGATYEVSAAGLADVPWIKVKGVALRGQHPGFRQQRFIAVVDPADATE